jgi:protein phosphatase 2C family protein 2/3
VLQQSKKAKLAKGQEQRARTFAYLSNLGGRTKNEDRVSVETITTRQCTYQYFAVFDGHGGYLTSNYLSLHLHLVLESFLSEERPPAEALRLSLALLEEKLRKNPRIGSKSGSCALVCLATGENCWVANVGDSRLLAVGEEGVVQVTRDHKPEQEAEKARILNNGGEVYRKLPEGEEVHSRDIPYRVYPGKLSVSRTIGDVHIKRENSRVVIADPEIFTVALKGLTHLLLLTDGVYEKLSNSEIANCFLPAARPEDGIRAVFELAESRRSEDNRSMVAVRFK